MGVLRGGAEPYICYGQPWIDFTLPIAMRNCILELSTVRLSPSGWLAVL